MCLSLYTMPIYSFYIPDMLSSTMVVFVQLVIFMTSLSMCAMPSQDGNNELSVLQRDLCVYRGPHGNSLINIVGICVFTMDSMDAMWQDRKAIYPSYVWLSSEKKDYNICDILVQEKENWDIAMTFSSEMCTLFKKYLISQVWTDNSVGSNMLY